MNRPAKGACDALADLNPRRGCTMAKARTNRKPAKRQPKAEVEATCKLRQTEPPSMRHST